MASSFLKGAAFFEQAGEEEEKRQERIVAKVSAEPVAESVEVKRGRPALDEAGEREKLVPVTAYLPESMKNDLKVYTAATGQSISCIVRKHLEAELAESGFLNVANKLKC